MQTRDPNRLQLIIRDREITLRRLRKALEDSKKDNRGDAFKINRFVKHHEKLMEELMDEYRSSVKELQMLHEIRRQQYAKIEQQEVDELRNSLALYSINE